MIDVRVSSELQATVFAFKTAAPNVRREMRKAARQGINKIWAPGLRSRADNRMERQVLVRGARAKVESDTFSLQAATSQRALSGGLDPYSQWPGVEFGATTKVREVYVYSRRAGRSFPRDQVAGAQFKPRKKSGYVIYPTVRDVGPKVVAAWVRGAVRGIVKSTEMETV